MPPNLWKWLKKDKEFIDLLKNYEETNAFCQDYANDNPLWLEISNIAKKPPYYCRRKWLGIKCTYLKLKNMIRIGRVTEDTVRMNSKTAKYLDGRLAFLDRFLFEIPDKMLPASVHRFFNKTFVEQADISARRVDVEILIKVKKNSGVIQVIKDYKQETGPEPTCILPNMEQPIKEEPENQTEYVEKLIKVKKNSGVIQVIKDYKQETGPEPTFILPNMEQPIKEEPENQTEYAIDDINVVDNAKPLLLHQDELIDSPNVLNNNSSRKLPSKNKKSEQEKISDDCVSVYQFLVKYSNANIKNEQKGNLKEYMHDLAEVLCNRLAPSNRQSFLSEVDLIVSEVLEGK